jgi:branched-chain amino acid transport system permease protein
VTASIFAQLIFNGIAIGLVYVFMASGFNLILSVTGIFFITFGMFYALGAYTTWWLVQLGVPYFAGVAISTVGTAIGGVILYLLVMRKIRTGEQGMLRVLIASIMLVTLLTQFVLHVFGTSPRGIPPVFKGHWKVWGVVIGMDRVAVILISIAILLALHFFLNRTRIGRGMRTVAFHPDVAALLGVNSEKVFITTIAVGLGLVGFAGGLMAPILGVDITMGAAGFMVLLVIILGGIGSMIGSILSGILLGVVIAFSQFYVSAGVGQIIFFAVVGIFFFFRPGGMFGSPPPDPVDGVASMTSAKLKSLPGKKIWIAPVILLAIALALPYLGFSSYWMHLMILVVIFAVTGMTFTFGMRSGMINVAAASFWGIGAYATGLLMTKAGMTFWQALPLAILISFVLALLLGSVICRFAGMSGMMFGIVFASVVPVAFGTFELFGKQSGLTSIPGVTDLGFIHFGSKASYYYLVLAFVIIGMIIMLAFTRAWTGRSWLGLGSSQKLAESVGIDPFGYRVINFAIMSVIPALLGTVYACYLGAIQPVTFGPFIGINFQIVAFVGGLGYLVAGPIVGALFMTLLPELLRVAGSYEPIITAIIIILVIMFLPSGIIGSQDARLLAAGRWVVRQVRRPATAVPVAVEREGAE